MSGRLKNYVCLTGKEALNNKWNIIYFGATFFFEVRGPIVL